MVCNKCGNNTFTGTPVGMVCGKCGTPFVLTRKGTGVPNPGTICGTIWGVCNTLYTHNKNVVPTRTQVLQVCVTPTPNGLGLNYHTTVTQYQKWVTHMGYNTQKGMVTPTLTQLGLVGKVTPTGN